MKHHFFKSILAFFIILGTQGAVFGQIQPNKAPLNDATISFKTSTAIGSQIMIELQSNTEVEVNWGTGKSYKKVSTEELTENGGLYGEVQGPFISLRSTDGITEIYFSNCNLQELQLSSANKLRLLSAVGNNLSSVKGLSTLPSLEELNLSRNEFTEIPLLPNLKQLRINTNRIKNTEHLNKMVKLEYIDCSNNNISNLDLSKLTLLRDIVAKSNSIKSINLSGCNLLETVALDKNQLTELVLSNAINLKKLTAANNKIEKMEMPESKFINMIDISPNKLSACELNKIFKILPTLEKAPMGKNIFIKGNIGAETSKTDLLIEKNWIADVKGNGTGCNEEGVDTIKPTTSSLVYHNGVFSFAPGAKQLVIYNFSAEKIISKQIPPQTKNIYVTLVKGEYIAVLDNLDGTKETIKISL